MRKILQILPILTLAAAAALATPAFAAPDYVNPNNAAAAPVVAGAVVGTAVGVGLYNGWYTGTVAASMPATAVGAAAIGGVAGVGTIALLEGVTAKCHGFGIFWTPRSECVNGQWVGDGPHRVMVR